MAGERLALGFTELALGFTECDRRSLRQRFTIVIETGSAIAIEEEERAIAVEERRGDLYIGKYAIADHIARVPFQAVHFPTVPS